MSTGFLDGKRAFVSGVGPGLGQAIARSLARAGATVMVSARRPESLAEIASVIGSEGGVAHTVQCDVTNPDQCVAAADAARSVMGGLDILVNSAFRMGKNVPFASAKLEKWEEVFQTNVRGSLNMTQSMIPLLSESEDARVVMIGSMSGRQVRFGEGAYAASKAALATVTKTLALELGAAGIRVNMVAPGWMWGSPVQTFVAWEVERKGVPEESVIAEITKDIPLGYIPLQEEVADVVTFFAGPASRAVTGQVLDVNGGQFFG